MAQSVTKTFTTGDVGVSSAAETICMATYVDGDGKEFYAMGIEYVVYNGSNTGEFNISAIPAGSTIESVHISWGTTKNSAFTTWSCTTSQFIDANDKALTDSNLLAYIRSMASFTKVKCRFTNIIPYPNASRVFKYDSDAGYRISPYIRYNTLKLTVTYTPPDEATVSYGTGNVWKMCNVCMAVNNAWQKVKVFFGTGGSWKQVK